MASHIPRTQEGLQARTVIDVVLGFANDQHRSLEDPRLRERFDELEFEQPWTHARTAPLESLRLDEWHPTEDEDQVQAQLRERLELLLRRPQRGGRDLGPSLDETLRDEHHIGSEVHFERDRIRPVLWPRSPQGACALALALIFELDLASALRRCKWCGSYFVVHHGRRRRAEYCSLQCSHAARKKSTRERMAKHRREQRRKKAKRRT